MNIQIKTSVGDFLDRWSILLIKEQKGLDVEKELSDYTKTLKPDFQDWGYYLRILEAINGELWELEDAVSYTHLTLPTICSV